MKNLISIEPIAVKDKKDVVKALTILERIGIEIKSEKEKKDYLKDKTKIVDNNFMIQANDGGFRIQSHYLGNGISMNSLEKQVNNIIKKHPDICEKLKEIENKKNELTKKINNMEVELKDSEKFFPLIELKEKLEKNNDKQ